MSDESLRALERAARAREGDLEAGWAYARALERAADRRALHLELCRLARAGDVRAGEALARWADPGAGLERAARTTLDLPRARARAVEDPTLAGARALVAARGDVVLACAAEAVVVVDLAAGAVDGGFPCGGLVAMRGDDVLHAAEDRRALLLRDLRGELVGRVDLPWPAGLLAARGDRGLVAPRDDAGPRHAIVGLDLGSDLRARWVTDAEHRASRLLVAGRRGLRVTTGWRLEALDLEAGALTDLGRLFRTHERRWLRDVNLRSDPDGEALVYRATYQEEDDDFGPEESEVILGEVDLATGDARWRVVGHWTTAGLWTSPGLAVVAAREGGAHALVGIERPTGRLRFEAVVGRAHAVVVTPEVIVAAGVTADGRRLALTHLDPGAGRVLARREVELGVVVEPDPAAVHVALGPAGLQAVVISDGVVASVEVPA